MTPGSEPGGRWFNSNSRSLDNGSHPAGSKACPPTDQGGARATAVVKHCFENSWRLTALVGSSLTWTAGSDERRQDSVIAADALVAGTNVIAVEVHNLWPGNNDLSFDLSLR